MIVPTTIAVAWERRNDRASDGEAMFPMDGIRTTSGELLPTARPVSVPTTARY
jgi:hypothetical protein